MKYSMNRLFPVVSFVLMAVFSGLGLTACGKDETGSVSFQSAAFDASSTARVNLGDTASHWVVVSSLSFCVTKLKVEAEDGEAIKGEDDNEFIEARLGLIEPGAGSTALSWGTANIPVGTELKRIKVELHKDPELCGGAEYSVSMNGSTISKDLEFKFAFPSGTTVQAGDVITFDLQNIVDALKQAYDASAFNDEEIGHYLENAESSCSKD